MYVAGADPYSIVKPFEFKTKMFFVTAEIGGDQARDLLLHNRKPEKDKEGTNRKASQTNINKYAAKMLLGEWTLIPQPIILSETEDGTYEVADLNDGQQRLMALVQASLVNPNLRIQFTFCFEAPRDSKWGVDQGKRRLPADFLAMAGEVNANQLSHAVRMLYAVMELRPFVSINVWRKADMAPKAYSEFLISHMQLRQGLQVSRDISVGNKALIMPHVGACLWWMLQNNFDTFMAQTFFTGLSSGANLDTDDPRLKVRDFLSLKRAEKYRWDGFEQLAVLIAAANAWLLGQERFVAKHAFSKLAIVYPVLMTRDEMPATMLVPGNNEGKKVS